MGTVTLWKLTINRSFPLTPISTPESLWFNIHRPPLEGPKSVWTLPKGPKQAAATTESQSIIWELLHVTVGPPSDHGIPGAEPDH